MPKFCIHCFISGRTQGVWFRQSTREKAQSLEITGWVKNLEDSRVEILACGNEQALQSFEQWLWKGPLLARVKNVICEPSAWFDFEDFAIEY